MRKRRGRGGIPSHMRIIEDENGDLSSSSLFSSRRFRSTDSNRKLSFHMRALGFSPLPEKMSTGGEDAYISTESVQAVLDGVSWWRDHLSVDAGLYSAALAKHMYEYVEDDLLGDLPASSHRLLQRGYELSKHSNVVGTATALVATLQRNEEGKERIYKKDGYRWINLEEWRAARDEEESTARLLCEAVDEGNTNERENAQTSSMASGEKEEEVEGKSGPSAAIQQTDGNHLEKQEQGERGVRHMKDKDRTLLDVSFVGDCGLMVIREGKIVYETEAQQHDVDYPFQLGDGSADTPKDGVRVLIPVRRGDVVVMGSDGIFDNVYSHDICNLMWNALSTCPFYKTLLDTTGEGGGGGGDSLTQGEGESALGRGKLLDQTLSALNKGIESVLAKATSIASDIRADSPYASRCIENGANFEGGKPDDMTILASILEFEENVADMGRLSDAEELFPSPYRDWP